MSTGSSHTDAHDALLTLPPTPRLCASLRALGLFDDGAITFARAPGRLDVMGGIADYTGSLVCEMPLAVGTAVAVQPRRDKQIVCQSAQTGRHVALPTDALENEDPEALRSRLDGDAHWAGYVIGCAWWLRQFHARQTWALGDGLSIALDSDVPLGGGVSSSAAIEVATMTALCGALRVDLAPMRLAAACQQVENRVVGAPCGVMDQVTSTLGQAGAMLALLCQPDGDGLPAQMQGNVRVPDGCAFVGVHSGVSHEVRGDPYTDTRTAAFMGQKILDALSDAPAHHGHLANVDPVRFENGWCAQLPEQLSGEEFISTHGDTDDPVTQVQPGKVYAVRAATTHHVQESVRVRRFVGTINRADQPDEDTEALRCEAGQLMYESHRSYSDNAALGHEATDRFVELVREAGEADGFYGAKITGGGCGGTVAVMLRDERAAFDALENLRRRYSDETGRPTILFQGTSPGAAALGTAIQRFEDMP